MPSRVCPKCGYQRKPADSGPAYECPHCGVIYEKHLARISQTVELEAERPPPAPGMSRKKRRGLAAASLAAAAIAIGVGFVLFVQSASGVPAKVVESFPYKIPGSWTGRIEHVYAGSGLDADYRAEFMAHLVVDKDFKVESLSWTDAHTPFFRSEWSFTAPHGAEAAAEERDGNAGPGAFRPLLQVKREEGDFAFHYAEPSDGEVTVDDKDVISGWRVEKKSNGVLEWDPKEEVIRGLVTVTLLPAGSYTLRKDGVKKIYATGAWAWDGCVKKAQEAGGELSPVAGYFENLDCASLSISTGNEAGFGFSLFVTKAKVSEEAGFSRSRQTVLPDMIRLGPESSVRVDAGAIQRRAAILFYRDGRRLLKVLDRTLGDGTPLTFRLDEAR